MSHDLGRLQCRICGQSIYFPLEGEEMKNGERLIELTCSRGHSDSYWDVETEQLDHVAPHAELDRVAAVGF
jgi:hypothetical protein